MRWLERSKGSWNTHPGVKSVRVKINKGGIMLKAKG